MRGEERQQRSMLMVMDVEQRVPREHPLRRIKQVTDTVLKSLSPMFEKMYSAVGRVQDFRQRRSRQICFRHSTVETEKPRFLF